MGNGLLLDDEDEEDGPLWAPGFPKVDDSDGLLDGAPLNRDEDPEDVAVVGLAAEDEDGEGVEMEFPVVGNALVRAL